MTLRRAIAALLAAASTGAALYLAPVQAGGQTSYAVVDGISMNPVLHAGDLVVVRTAPSYGVGDVVLYRNPFLRRDVLHRILKVQDGRYYFKGDNNEFVDPGYATRDQLIGKLWFQVAGVGKALTWLGRPTHAGIVATGVTLLLLLGTGASSQRRRRKRPLAAAAPLSRRLLHRPRRNLENGVFFVAAPLACVIAAVAFIHPLDRAGSESAYTQRGSFSYSGTANGLPEVYPAGRVRTGQTIFLANVDRLRVGFTYRFETTRPHGVEGTAALRILVSSDAISWHDLIAGRTTRFSGDTVTVSETLDLTRIQALAQKLVAASGAVGADYRISIQPVVRVHGLVAGAVVRDAFSPSLPMSMTQSMLKVVPPAQPTLPGASYATPSASALLTAALSPAETGTIPASTANTISLLRYRVPVGSLRGVSVGLAALALLALLLKPLRPKREIWSNERRIAHRRGCILVGVAEIAAPAESSILTVPRFEDLATLAEQQNAPIMHAARADGSRYAVEHGRHLYVFEAPPAPPSPPPAERRRVRGPRPGGVPRPAYSLLALGALLLTACAVAGFTATTTVPPSRAGVSTSTASAAQLAPAACSGLALTGVLYATGNSLSNNRSNTLIIGRSVNDNIADAGRNDCIVGGGGQDNVNAQTGSVCIANTNPKSTYKGCTRS